MIWLGKLFGALLGSAIGGPLGGFFCIGIGHQLDRELTVYKKIIRLYTSCDRQQNWHKDLLRAEFTLAGCLARAGNLQTQRSFTVFGELSTQKGLSYNEREAALAFFYDGLDPNCPLIAMLNDIRRQLYGRPDLVLQLLISLLLFNRLSAPVLKAQNQALESIAGNFGFNASELDYISQIIDAQITKAEAHDDMDIQTAYSTLGLSPQATDADITRAYRRLMSRHHPDKITYKNPSAEELAEATVHTHRIRQAYKILRKLRDNSK